MNIKNQYQEAFAYLKEIQIYFYLSVFAFIASAFYGFFEAESLKGVLNPLIQQIISKTNNLNGFELFVFIFQNNVSSAFFAFLGGIFLGIFPIFALLGNGLLLGYVFNRVYLLTGNLLNIWKILPHGIFELPAIFISISMGIRLGFFFFYGKDKRESFIKTFYNCVNVFFFVVIPLLLIAAIIESLLIVLIG